MKRNKSILTLNSGSSSLKFSLFEQDDAAIEQAEHASSNLKQKISGNLSGIGSGAAGHIRIKQGSDKIVRDEKFSFANHKDATEELMHWLGETVDRSAISIVGHRIVHGGTKYHSPLPIDERVIADLSDLSRFAPLHLPASIATLESAQSLLPNVRQIACFDTSFHRCMPEVAKILPLTRELYDEGVEKFGFHGLSYEYIMHELSQRDESLAGSRLIIAHLGNGCSMAAVKDGKCRDTTMAFSPAGGLVMGTRCGDIDAGLVTYFCENKGYSASQFVALANQKSGLLGLSRRTSDMQDLLEHEGEDSNAGLAIEVFCYSARKFIGALSSVLGGLDALIFTGGIGENSAPVRARICQGLQYLGIAIDSGKNEASNFDISADRSATKTLVLKTNEELMIALHCRALSTD